MIQCILQYYFYTKAFQRLHLTIDTLGIILFFPLLWRIRTFSH